MIKISVGFTLTLLFAGLISKTVGLASSIGPPIGVLCLAQESKRDKDIRLGIILNFFTFLFEYVKVARIVTGMIFSKIV